MTASPESTTGAAATGAASVATSGAGAGTVASTTTAGVASVDVTSGASWFPAPAVNAAPAKKSIENARLVAKRLRNAPRGADGATAASGTSSGTSIGAGFASLDAMALLATHTNAPATSSRRVKERLAMSVHPPRSLEPSSATANGLRGSSGETPLGRSVLG